MTALNKIFAHSSHGTILQTSDFDWINTIGQIQTYLPGTFLLKAGDSAKAVYLPLQGQLATTITQADGSGSQAQLILVSLGDVLGEMLFLDHRPVTTNVVAVERSDVLALPTQTLVAKLGSDRLPQLRL
jgi:CRP-like cAMP-binding protein